MPRCEKTKPASLVFSENIHTTHVRSPFMIAISNKFFKLLCELFLRSIWNQDVLDRRKRPAIDQGLPKIASERPRPEMK